MSKSGTVLTTAVIVAALGAGYYYWTQQQIVPVPPPAPEPVAVPVVPAAPVPAPAASVPVEPAVKYPVDAIAPEEDKPKQPLPALAQSDGYAKEQMLALLGDKNVKTFLQTDEFVRRVVATVDNLAREHAAPSLWPVNPTPGRFSTLKQQGAAGEIINPDNGQRYVPLVLLLESVNLKQAVGVYAGLYPLLQQAYQELGFPRGYFNDRLVAVIDHLLVTPVQAGPTGVKLVAVKGPVPSQRPWTRYEFSDPKLEALTAGQKILIRSGPVNHRRIQTRLLEIRKLLTSATLAPPAAKASQ